MFDDKEREFRAVVNDEEQYSIWPSDRDLPVGWRAVGPVGSRADCLAYIDESWTDMRPLSLRQAMAADRTGPAAAETRQGANWP
jgi:MbtH protein